MADDAEDDRGQRVGVARAVRDHRVMEEEGDQRGARDDESNC
jgi:hypothetical protein